MVESYHHLGSPEFAILILFKKDMAIDVYTPASGLVCTFAEVMNFYLCQIYSSPFSVEIFTSSVSVPSTQFHQIICGSNVRGSRVEIGG